MPRINLLPWREQERTERKKTFAVGMFLAMFAAAVVTLGGYMFMRGLIDSQYERNQKLVAEIAVLDKDIEEINSLDQRKRQFIARMQIIEKLQRSRPEIVHTFDSIVKTIPDGMYLTSIVQNGQKFRMQGVTQASSRVSAFIRQLDGSGWFTNSYPSLVQNSSFTVDAVQVTTVDNSGAN